MFSFTLRGRTAFYSTDLSFFPAFPELDFVLVAELEFLRREFNFPLGGHTILHTLFSFFSLSYALDSLPILSRSFLAYNHMSTLSIAEK